MLSLRIALGGGDLVALARQLARLDGVRVTGGPGGERERCFLVSCSGFKMVLSCPADEPADCAAALVSRTPSAALTVVSDLGSLLDRLMSEPPPSERGPTAHRAARGGDPQGDPEGDPEGDCDDPSSSSSGGPSARPSTPLRRSELRQSKPLTRKTQLTRKTPLARSPFRKPWPKPS